MVLTRFIGEVWKCALGSRLTESRASWTPAALRYRVLASSPCNSLLSPSPLACLFDIYIFMQRPQTFRLSDVLACVGLPPLSWGSGAPIPRVPAWVILGKHKAGGGCQAWILPLALLGNFR